MKQKVLPLLRRTPVPDPASSFEVVNIPRGESLGGFLWGVILILKHLLKITFLFFGRFVQYCYNKYMRFLGLISIFLLLCVQSWGFFPFNFGKEEVKTDYSQTVWDRIMLEQSLSDMRRGMGEMSSAKYRQAANSFAKAIIKNPQEALPHFLYGSALYWSGNVDGAITEYREGLRLDPQSPMGYQLLGIAWGWKGNIETAQENFLKAYTLDPSKADTHMNLGSTYAAQKNFEKALDHFRQAVELAPREALYQYQLGNLYDFMGRDEQAETAYKKALKLFFKYEDAQLALGALYEKREDYANALKYYKKAVKTKEGDFVARLRYAYLLLRQGQKQTAREVLEGAFSIVRFKSDGLALNAVYRARGCDQQTFQEQIKKFKESLLKVPVGKDIQVEVALDFVPPAEPQKEAPKSKFAEQYQALRGKSPISADGLSPISFKRNFSLVAADQATRQQQVQELAEELARAVTAGSEKYDVNMALQGRTLDFRSPSALTQHRTAPPKAVYDPRIVGNDMGLWVMGKSWVRYVEEIENDLQEEVLNEKGTEYLLLQGLAGLVSGQAGLAAHAFAEAQQKSPQDPLPLLGLGTAAVINADDELAKTYYGQALSADPENKTAKKNLKVLEDE